jgi:hypothetical protein
MNDSRNHRHGPGHDHDGRGIPDELAELDAELAGVTRSVERQVDPGQTAVAVAVGVLLAIAALVLPWSGAVAGWAVLAGTEWIGPLPRLFAFVLVGVGVLGSSLALAARLFALAWVCAVGSGISVVTGVWAIWSRQTGVPDGLPGPGPGLIVALLAAVVLTTSWVRIAGRR